MSKATPPWIDISVPLRPGMVQWPGDPKLRVERIRDMANGEICNVSTLSMCVYRHSHGCPAALHRRCPQHGENAPRCDHRPRASDREQGPRVDQGGGTSTPQNPARRTHPLQDAQFANFLELRPFR